MSSQLTLRDIVTYAILHPEHLDAKVWAEGCDCTGEAESIEVDSVGDLLVARHNGGWVPARAEMEKLRELADKAEARAKAEEARLENEKELWKGIEELKP